MKIRARKIDLFVESRKKNERVPSAFCIEVALLFCHRAVSRNILIIFDSMGARETRVKMLRAVRSAVTLIGKKFTWK